jgi:hypothetical protein
LGGGDGTFTSTALSSGTGTDPAQLAVGDFNGDGAPDIAVANLHRGTVTILLNTGSGNFSVSSSPLAGNGPLGIAATDLNGNGVTDLIVTDFYGA